MTITYKLHQSDTSTANPGEQPETTAQPESGNNYPLVILVHGLTCDGSDWAAVVSTLNQHSFDCMTVDLRGHGKSADLPGPYSVEQSGKDLAELITAKSLDNVVLVGHSMGTRVVLECRDRLPDPIRQIVFVDGSCQAQGDPELARQSMQTLLSEPDTTALMVSKMFEDMFGGTLDSRLSQQIIQRAANMPTGRVSQLLVDMHGWDAGELENSLLRLNAAARTGFSVLQSTSLDSARKRRNMRPGESSDYLDLLRTKVRRASIEVLENTGHFIQLEHPERVSKVIIKRFAV